MPPILFLLPIVASLIGWLTNYLAVKMLFHPRLPFGLLGMTIQGVFPKRQKQLAEKLGILVADELFSIKDVTNNLKELATNQDSMELVGKRIEKTIREKLVKSFPMLAMFLTDEMVEKVTNLFKVELQDFLGESVHDLGEKLEKSLNVEKLVRDKVEAFSSDKLEAVLFSIMRKEFRFIEIIGAILGFLIGCVQVGLTLISY
jgi:uncharacterized membrane protein YheB (UPF0754 family)|tara:strand:+ start:983 stop:1588 length:606 start_codon:yes stop_codon:yes gene_type:complete